MTRRVPERDPRSELEDEGIPDMQDGTPGQQWSVDPQQQPVPGDQPMAVDDYGTTVDEQIQGEPLSDKLAREVPDEQPVEGEAAAQPEEPSGQFWDEPRPAGRLVSPDEGAREVEEPQEIADEVGPDAGGYSAEESAMRVEPE